MFRNREIKKQSKQEARDRRADLLHQERFFDDASSLEELVDSYDKIAGELARAYEEQFAEIPSRHEHGFSTLAPGADKSELEILLSMTYDTTKTAINAGNSAAQTLTEQYRQKVVTLLDDDQLALLGDAIDFVGKRELLPFYINHALGGIRDENLRRAFRMFFDGYTYQAVQKAASGEESSAKSHMNSVLSTSSSRNVNDLLRTSADHILFEKLFVSANTNGVDSSVKFELGDMSSREVIASVRSALDKAVYEKVVIEALKDGVDESTETITRQASDRSVTSAFDRYLHENKPWLKTIYKDWVRSDSQRERREKRHRQQQHKVGGHATKESVTQPVDKEVLQIVQTVIESDKSFQWLAGENPQDVRRVINTVRAVREEAVAQGLVATDRSIFLKYKKLVNKGQGYEHEINPDTIVSERIISALMGGKLSGKLPF